MEDKEDEENNEDNENTNVLENLEYLLKQRRESIHDLRIQVKLKGDNAIKFVRLMKETGLSRASLVRFLINKGIDAIK